VHNRFGESVAVGLGEPRKLTTKVAEHLKAAIVDGELVPGTRIIERDVGARLGVSRVPVREAIQTLADEGLLTKIPYRGAFVSVLSQRDLEEISSLRLVLELFAVERVIKRWDEQHDANMKQLVDEMYAALSSNGHERFYRLDVQFHGALWEIADHGLLLDTLLRIHTRIVRFIYQALTLDGLEKSVVAHAHLLESIRSGAVAGSKDMMSEHILSAEANAVASLAHGRRD
jgi:DNA-binding GntR family transcriptional regulator